MEKKKKKARPSKIYAGFLREKNKLDWGNFNFLENLLVFCILNERNAPWESKGGVQFRINPKTARESLCLMFHIDRREDPLIKGLGIKRPDYMVLFAEPDNYICTIVEMKGGTEKGFKHGVAQIKVLRDRLREELKINASKVKLRFQAIMMIPYVSDIPRKLIEKEEEQGLVILPLQYDHKAELFNYVSKINKLSERYVHEEIRPSRANSVVENLLMNYAVKGRRADNFAKTNKDKTNKGEGIYINYDLPNKAGYAALATDNSGTKVGVNESKDNFINKIKSDLTKLGLKAIGNFEIIRIN